MTKLYKAGIYCRLSVEDSANSAKVKSFLPADESVSIENQYALLSKFTMLNGWTEIKSYRDDGYSGGNFRRPAFLEMLEDARHGLINLILVKDLSRLGRDFVEVGRYTDIVFPALGCRFVSVLDALDSEGDQTDMLHFRSLMNDYHLKDLSNKVKSILHAKMQSGQFLSSYAPYGYRKNDADRHKLLVDEEAAMVVRRLFEMRKDGASYSRITATLNREGILPPRWYWEQHYGSGSCKYERLWKYATVRNLLRNPVYIGMLRQNTTGSRSYKDATMICKPETDWITHKEAHQAIISQEVWTAVQEINRKAASASKHNAPCLPGLFSGKLVCADCGSFLSAAHETRRSRNGTENTYVSYYCSRHTTSGRSTCSWHRIYEKHLQMIVESEIRTHAQALILDEAAMVDTLKKRIIHQDTLRMADYRGESVKLRRRIQELEQMIAKLYEDKVAGAISSSAFSVLLQNNEQERRQKAERLEEQQALIKQYEQDQANIQKWAKLIRDHQNRQELDHETVEELIDHIEIGERTICNGQRHQSIKIYYRFVGLME